MVTPARTPVFTILALWLAGLGAAAQYAKISVIYERLGGLYPEAGASLGFVVSLVGLIGIFLGVTAGLLVARIRYRRAMLWALWVGAAVSAFQATIPSFPVLLLSRLIEGASHLAIVVAAPTLIAQLCAPGHRGFALSLWSGFFAITFAILAWVGPPLVDSYGLWALFASHTVWMAGFALLLAMILPRIEEQPPEQPLSLGGIINAHRLIYRSPWLSAPAMGWLFYTFCFVALLTLLPPFIAPEKRALVIGAMPLASIAVAMTLGVWLLRRIAAVRVVEAGFALSTGLSCLLLWWPGHWLICIALAGAMGLIQGASFALVAQLNHTAEARAQSNGAVAQMGNLGNTLGTPVMAAMIASGGYEGMIAIVAVMLVGGCMVHLVMSRMRAALSECS